MDGSILPEGGSGETNHHDIVCIDVFIGFPDSQASNTL